MDPLISSRMCCSGARVSEKGKKGTTRGIRKHLVLASRKARNLRLFCWRSQGFGGQYGIGRGSYVSRRAAWHEIICSCPKTHADHSSLFGQ